MKSAGWSLRRLLALFMFALVVTLTGCGTELPEAAGDLDWLLENGAIDQVPDGWEKVDSNNRKGFEQGGERFPTLAIREFRTLDSAAEVSDSLTAVAVEAGWEPGWSVCGEREARIGFRYPGRDDVLLTSRISPAGDGIGIEVTAVFDRAGWAREGMESMECFEQVKERIRLLEELPPLQSLDQEEIDARLTASEVANIFDRPGITSRPHDGRRVQFLDGEDFILVVEKIYGGIPELDGFDRDDIYLLEEASYANRYRVGLGDASVDVVDYTKSDFAVIEEVAVALKD